MSQVSALTLVRQTLVHGTLPKLLANRMVCRVLIDNMTTIISEVERKKRSGEHAALIAQLDLGPICAATAKIVWVRGGRRPASRRCSRPVSGC